MEWTNYEIQKLKELTAKGFPASEIARVLGRSRSAVLGKLMRIREASGEPAKPRSQVSATKTNPRSRPTVRRSEKLAAPKPKPKAEAEFQQEAAPVNSLRIPFMSTGHSDCRWIDGEPGPDGLPTCCGHPIPEEPGLMFCAHHRQLSKGAGTEGERRAVKYTPRAMRKEAA